jgi:hypothetical protein
LARTRKSWENLIREEIFAPLDAGNALHRATAMIATLNLDAEHAFQALRPAQSIRASVSHYPDLLYQLRRARAGPARVERMRSTGDHE